MSYTTDNDIQIKFYLTVEKDEDLTQCARFQNLGIMEHCVNGKGSYPFWLEDRPKLINISCHYTFDRNFMISHLYNNFGHWINPGDHILVYNGKFLPQFMDSGYNTNTLFDYGIQENDTIHSYRITLPIKIGKCYFGNFLGTNDDYIISPDGIVTELPHMDYVRKQVWKEMAGSASLTDKWVRFLKKLEERIQISTDPSQLRFLQPIIDDVRSQGL